MELTPPALALVSDPDHMVGAGEFGIATQPRPLPSVPDLPPPSPTAQRVRGYYFSTSSTGQWSEP